MYNKYPIHLLIRYSDNLYKINDVSEEHNNVISLYGSVWFGKVGKTLGLPHIEKIKKQITKSEPSYLLLVQRVGKKYSTYRGRINDLSRSFPKASENLIPSYYFSKGLIDNINLWINISELLLMEGDYLRNFRVISSIMTIEETLSSSMAALFIIKELNKSQLLDNS